ncbi:hypothetical protein [Ruegeria jejuensis]|uniref:hypothetical protein n=1 Tax=Ruegeria jejuensis TaxID=3233338 RepID=UPI00355C4928
MTLTFHQALKKAVETRGTDGKKRSLKSIAEGSGVSYEQLKKVNQKPERSTNIDDAKKVAKFLGLTIDQFLDDEDIGDQAELVSIYNRLSPEERQFWKASGRGIAGRKSQGSD